MAEKLEAMVSLGAVNTRMKDFYDVWLLANTRAFDGATLARAIAATFARRATPLPATIPTAFMTDFARDTGKQAQWRAVVARSRLADAPPDFEQVTTRIAAFARPAMNAARGGRSFTSEWRPEAGWLS